MKYVLILLAISIVAISVTAFIYYRLYKKFKNDYEQEHLKFECLQEEYSKLVEAYKIKKQNKEKADEKVSDLHSGNTSADDILPKRKSRK